jgi:hypothetical protein
VLRRLTSFLEPDGRLVLVEYDRERGNRWVPYPISRARLRTIASEAELTAPLFVGTSASAYGGEMYCAVLSLGSESS